MKEIKILALIVAVISLISLFASCDNKDNSQTPDDKDVLGTTNGDLNYIINGDGSISIGSGSFGGNYVVDENGNITIVVGGNSVSQGNGTTAQSYESYQKGIYTKGILNESPSTWDGGGFWVSIELSNAIIKAIYEAPDSDFNVNVSFKAKNLENKPLVCAYLSPDKDSEHKFDVIKESSSLDSEKFTDFIANFQIKGSVLETECLYLYVEGETLETDTIGDGYSIKNVKIVISPVNE